MSRLFSSFWIYGLSWLMFLAFGIYLLSQNPSRITKLTSSVRSKYSALNSNPCHLQIAGGVPHSSKPDAVFQVNLDCGPGQKSYNYLLLDAVPGSPTIANALNLVSEINSFKFQTGQEFSLGNLSNTSAHSWQILLNSVPVTDLNLVVPPGGVLHLIYE